jgi:hypothetical protein
MEVTAAVEREMTGSNKSFTILDPVASFKGETLKALTTTKGASIWLQNDPVHLTPAAYAEWTAAIRNLVSVSLPPGRKRIASVVKESTNAGGRGGWGGQRGNVRGGLRGANRGGWRGGRYWIPALHALLGTRFELQRLSVNNKNSQRQQSSCCGRIIYDLTQCLNKALFMLVKIFLKKWGKKSYLC